MAEALDRLRPILLGDRLLFHRLAQIADLDQLTGELAALAEQHGFALVDGEVDEALRSARRCWLERWV